MSESYGFPRQLLHESTEVRRAYFETYAMAHPRLTEADEALIRAILDPAGASLVFVYGPTGVGKTTLRRHVTERLIRSALPDLEIDRGRIPVVAVEAIAPESGNFNWKDHFIRSLEAMDEPLIDRKIDYPVRAGMEAPTGSARAHATAPALRRAFEQALKYRRPYAYIIDEAQHLMKMTSGRRLQDQLDCIKSLAAESGTTHVLIGTYELLPFRNLSGQLSRRSADIHLPRYHCDRDADRRDFQRAIANFQRHLPLEQEPDLVAHWEFLYERSIGCVGVLKDWLGRALAVALAEGAQTLTLTHLKGQALSVAQCEKMAREAMEGEAKVTENPTDKTRLRQLLAIPAAYGPAPNTGQSEEKKKTKGTRVGERKPTRDPVGRAENVG